MADTNAFTNDSGDRPIEITISDSCGQLSAADSTQLVYVLLNLSPPESAQNKDILPLNLSLVIDRSTSMKGVRLDKVKTAAKLIIEKLSPRDNLSIISYSDRAEVVVPATKVDDRNRLSARVNQISASGGTEILQGLKAGIRELRNVPLQNYVNHLILLTDGHTYGDDKACLDLAERSASRGIGISAFGIGEEWNDEFLDSLVAPSGGQTGYIAEPEQVIHLLRQRIQGLGVIYAQNVQLREQFPPAVQIKDAFKLSPFAQPLKLSRNQLNLGTIEGEVPLVVLLELLVDFAGIGQILTLPMRLVAEIPTLEKPSVSIGQTHGLIVNTHPQGQTDSVLLEAVQILNLYRMHEQALHEVSHGDTNAATKRMERLTQRFREAGLNGLAQTAKAQTLHLAQTGKVDVTGRMSLKFATRQQLTSRLTATMRE